MAGTEKILGFRIEVRGTEKQTSQMNKLTLETERMKVAIRKLNKTGKINKGLTDKEIIQRKQLTTQIQANNRAYNKLNATNKKSSSFTSKMGKSIVGAGAAMFGIGAAIGLVTRLVSGAVKIFVEFEKANSKLKAVLGATGSEMDSLKVQSKALGSSTAYTASQVVELQTEYAKLGFPTADILNMTEATLNGAAALGSELGEQAALTGALLKQYSLDSTEAARVNDVLAKSASSSALDFSKLSTALPIVGATANSVGLSLERTTALLGTLSDRGIDASTSGTALRNVFLELSKQGLTYEEAMAKINGSTDKAKTAMELFGKRGATVGIILADTGDEVKSLEEKLISAEGAAKIMAETMLDNLAGDVTKAKSAYEGFILSIEDGSGSLSNAIRQYTQLSTVLLGFFTDLNNGKGFMDSYNDAVTKNIISTGGLSEQAEILGVSQEALTNVVRDNFEAYEIMYKQMADGTIDIDQFRQGIEKLGSGFADAAPSSERLRSQMDFLTKKFDEGKIGVVAYNEELQKLKKNLLDAVRSETKDNIEAKKAAMDAEVAAKIKATEDEAAAAAIVQANKEKTEQAARDKSLAADKAANKKAASDKAKAYDSANDFLLEKQRVFGKDENELKRMNLEKSFNDKRDAIIGNGEKETQLKLDIEIQRDLALNELKAELKLIQDEKTAESDLIERELQLETAMILAGEDFAIQAEIREKQRALELSDRNLTETAIANIKAKHRAEDIVNERTAAALKKQTNTEIAQSAAGLAGAISSLLKEGSNEAKAFAIAQAGINGALAITQALAQLGPIAGAFAAAGIVITTGIQIAKIKSAKYQDGGLVEGASHDQGGIQMYQTSGEHLGEMEGNEYIISAKRTQEIGVSKLDAMNFGNESPNLSNYFARGGSVASAGATQKSSQLSMELLGMVIADQMQGAIAQIKVSNDATETLSVALEVENQKVDLNFG